MKRSSDVFPGLVKPDSERRALLAQLLCIQPGAVVESGVHEFLLEGLMLFADLLMQAEVRELVGKRYERNADRSCVRWGEQNGQISALGQRVSVKKPRVRAAGGGCEIGLRSYEELSERDILNERAAQKLLCGVSTRAYEKDVEKLVRGCGIGRQSVSRRAIAEMTASLEDFRNRRFEHLDILTIFIDGIGLGERLHIAALGIDSQGKKHVLAIQQGSSEHSEVCKDLLANLLDRGLSVDRQYLFVIDGSKALAKALREVFGERCHIQRCLEHKKRNVEARLPKEYCKTFREKMEAAYAKVSLAEAEDAFEKLRRELLLISPSAADRLVDGLPQLLTLHKLGLGKTLRQSLRTTNCIESIFASARYYMRNVKRWRTEEQADRWLASGLLQAERNLRRIPGYTQLRRLKQSLQK